MIDNSVNTIVIDLDLSWGKNAVDYTPQTAICPILSILCIRSIGSGTVKITPLRSIETKIETALDYKNEPLGKNGRLRVKTDVYGSIENVEIANEGYGYEDGVHKVFLEDPYGSDGIITCTASEGVIKSVSIDNSGKNYSGYVEMDISDFIEGVTYSFIPRYIELSEERDSNSVLKLFGYRYSYRPFTIF